MDYGKWKRKKEKGEKNEKGEERVIKGVGEKNMEKGNGKRKRNGKREKGTEKREKGRERRKREEKGKREREKGKGKPGRKGKGKGTSYLILSLVSFHPFSLFLSLAFFFAYGIGEAELGERQNLGRKIR